MKELGLTQAKLGERVGLSQVSIGNIINGKTTDTPKILQIAIELRSNPEWLLNGTGNYYDAVGKNTAPLALSEAEWTKYTPKARQFLDEILFLIKNKKIDDSEISVLQKMTSVLSQKNSHHVHA
jgi:transcriptional regulator with XRE-family HTH domain